MRMLTIVTLAALSACSTTTSAEPPAPEADPVAAPAEPAAAETVAAASPVARGAEVFATNCASCHGPEGRGDGPAAAGLDPSPPDLRGVREARFRGIPRRQIIEEGRPGTAMIAWKEVLSPEDLDAVYAFVHDMHHGSGGGMGGGGMGGGGRGMGGGGMGGGGMGGRQ